MRLSGITIRNFRSIGNTPVELRPWRKCNILIGQNNAGKSNVIKALQKISTIAKKEDRQQPKPPLEKVDLHNRSVENQFMFTLYFESDTIDENELMKIAGTNCFHFDFLWKSGNQRPQVSDHSLAHIKDISQANDISLKLLGNRWPSHVSEDVIRKNFIEEGQKFLNPFLPFIPSVYIIPEFRQIQPGSEYSFSGTNLVGLLASYQHPDEGQDYKRDKFDQVQHLIRRLLHLPDAILEVTHDSSTITLKNNGLRLPLKDYGTGVHELVILVTAILSIDNSICCIEEPEIHLHPTLQREFIEFITTETSNQYLISTHSPTLINAHSTMLFNARENIQVFHLRTENNATVGDPVLKNEDSLIALADLGVKASDILQSNCVIWVEGPSDRIYIIRWLELIAPDLIEGLHFSTMFYGGKLLCHLSVDRECIPEELVEILRINQYAIVVMDDDRDKPRQQLRSTKKRIQEECESTGNYCWITDGREIENYLSAGVISAACEEIIGMSITLSVGKYAKFEEVLSEAVEAAGIKPFDYSSDKVRYARILARYFDQQDIDANPQLKKRLEDVVLRIRKWNQ